MDFLNYHHLLYFWTAAREGSIAAAAKRLHLARPTVTGQIRALENTLGEPLFQRQGRRLVLTEFGEVAFRYADDIFTTGRELEALARGGRPGHSLRLVVGIPDVLPKLVVFRLLAPAFDLPESFQLVCREGRLEDLMADLAVHRFDLVLSDTPLAGETHVHAYSHKLGECGVSLFAATKLAGSLRRGFPDSLHEAPFLLPSTKTALRTSLDRWFEQHAVRPHVAAEIDDSALTKVLGQAGRGVFAAPTIIESEIVKQYAVRKIGDVEGVRERYYAISVERKLRHPAVVAIMKAARKQLFDRPSTSAAS
ncbi:MAG: transcriptional activator NhaR [Planctomycetales bacterium]|nr:transcriptional activator NhaR [Planctomycetales bacterium]